MIAKIKVVTNQGAIEAAHREQQQSDMMLQASPESERIIIPIPEPVFEETDLLFDASLVTLAYQNGNGGIMIDYKDKSFTLIYEDELWEMLKCRFDEMANNATHRLLNQ